MLGYYAFKKTTWSRSHSWVHAEDGLISFKNSDFLADENFQAAYHQGISGAGGDYAWRWRVHVGLWAASHARRLPGDFVECGVNRGFLSAAVMAHLQWEKVDKQFYLFDTFAGLDKAQLSPEEVQSIWKTFSTIYPDCFAEAQKTFQRYPNARLVRGSVPDTLATVPIERVAYLSIDMNCVKPEVAALDYFWPKLVTGAVVLLDDYGHRGHERQKEAIDRLMASKGIGVLTLPTGQGMIVKP